MVANSLILLSSQPHEMPPRVLSLRGKRFEPSLRVCMTFTFIPSILTRALQFVPQLYVFLSQPLDLGGVLPLNPGQFRLCDLEFCCLHVMRPAYSFMSFAQG